MILTEEQLKQLKDFTRYTFDIRLMLALTNQTFASQAAAEKRKRARFWLLHYAKVFLGTLGNPLPAYNEAYPFVLKYLSENSAYLWEFAQPGLDTKIHICTLCQNAARADMCYNDADTKYQFGDGFGGDNIIRCNRFMKVLIKEDLPAPEGAAII